MATKKRKFAATLPDAAALEQFTAGADKKIELVAPQPTTEKPVVVTPPPQPRTSVDERMAKATNGINLRLNDYQLNLIRQVAALDDRSIQRTLKRILIPALEQRLESRS